MSLTNENYTTDDTHSNMMAMNKFLDFLEFLETELGAGETADLLEKFNQQFEKLSTD